MNITEREFTQLVQEQKSTIYTVCYMFARDKDEAADLFQDQGKRMSPAVTLPWRSI